MHILATGKRTLFSLALAAALTATIAGPALAITDGQLDGNDHPYVGLMTAHAADGDYLWRCSGTLLDATHFVTAGHCTEAPADYAVIYFGAGPIIPDPAFTLETRSCDGIAGYPCGGGYVASNIYTHPEYDPTPSSSTTSAWSCSMARGTTQAPSVTFPN